MDIAAFALSTVLSFHLPSGAALYLEKDGAFARIDGIHTSVTVVGDARTAREIGQYREIVDSTVKARAGLEVKAFSTRQIAGRRAIDITSVKSRQIPQMDETGKRIMVEVQERTRHLYLDTGPRDVVITLWTTDDEADLEQGATEFLAGLIPGRGTLSNDPVFSTKGRPAFTANLPDPLTALTRIDISSE